ncbi:hypothetical protein [Streptomyces sp. NPDC047985]|uniref:hypothetical protein n=1 Tax=Streptomyces sp. NPDC047985 TaxID=3155384 RepID=UPI003412640A
MTPSATPFVPARDDIEDEFQGVLVASFEDGGAIALTVDKARALEALDTYYRQVCGFTNILDDPNRPLTDAYYFLDSGHARFYRTEGGGWEAIPVAASAEGAVGVTWLTEPGPRPVPVPYAAPSKAALW